MHDDLVAAVAFGLEQGGIGAGENGGKVFLGTGLDYPKLAVKLGSPRP